MTDLQKKVVIAYAENDMRLDKAAAAAHYHRNTIQYHIEQIRRKTGLNPKKFFDLVKLYRIATGEEKE